jgi:benzoyl-CoA 2,3-dioxygenase component B
MGIPSKWDDWLSEFEAWRNEIGFDDSLIQDYKFEAKYAPLDSPAIEFGDYKGEKKWKSLRDVPDQRIRDSLLHLIVYQGDTEFASVEQQRHLVKTAPTDYDLKSLIRVMCEEMRHGWQMCHVMMQNFGRTGAVEAQKQLKRRSYGMQGREAKSGGRLLGSFNVDCRDWIDFFTFTQFIDRDGKFQLKMLSHGAFLPLSESMGPMLKEEAFHMGTGNNGLLRIAKAKKIPIPLLQKYFNKWVPTGYDLFGQDKSSTAEWAYVWGVKGRPEEWNEKTEADKHTLNDYSRTCYYNELKELTDQLNKKIQEAGGETLIHLPDMRFNRAIGKWKVQRDESGRALSNTHDIYGNPIPPEKFDAYVESLMPSAQDLKKIDEIFAAGDWIAPTRF